jgi:hypothetical protein
MLKTHQIPFVEFILSGDLRYRDCVSLLYILKDMSRCWKKILKKLVVSRRHMQATSQRLMPWHD